MRRTLIALALMLCPYGDIAAWGQATVLQGGSWTPGHLPQYVGPPFVGPNAQPIVMDGGGASGGGPGANASELGLVARGTGTAPFAGQGSGAFGSINCLYDAPTTNATGYHFLCFSPNASTGTGLVSYGAGGTASPLALEWNINGSTYTFPASGTGTGNVNGPVSTTAGHIAYWNSTNGTLLGDEAQITLANLPTLGANTVLGSIAGGTPVALSNTQLTTLCNAFTSSLSGCVPASGGGTTNFLRADGSFAVPNATTSTGLTSSGSIIFSTAAATVQLKQGANGAVGTFICTSGGSITVTNSNVAITDTIIISLNTAGGSISTAPALNAITASTSFVAKCATSDTSTYNYAIIKNAA